jgi:sialic acid synthase SpsE
MKHLSLTDGKVSSNLQAILALKEKFTGYLVGFSDHSTELISPSITIALGVCVIEKH